MNLDINYEGLFNEENIETFLRGRSYQDNVAIWDKLYKHYKEYSLLKFNTEEFIELKLLLAISLKYNYQREKTKSLIYDKMVKLESALFHLRRLYFKLLPNKNEKELWLDECIEYFNNKQSEHSLQDLCKFLEIFIYDTKEIDRSKYKEIYADTCMKVAESFTGLVACNWYILALPIYKQLDLKEKYHAALKKYNENMESVKDEFQVHETLIENTEMKMEIFKQRRIVYEFFKNQLETIDKKISALSNIFVFKKFGKFTYKYMPFFQKTENDFSEYSMLDFCHVVTFSGNKTVKTPDDRIGFDWIGRELTREMQIMPAVQGLLDGTTDKMEVVNEILKSPLIMENDQRHIKKAMSFFVNEDYDTFIYIIIPNFEKILRNVLVLNGVSDYVNKNTNTEVQTTLNLTETISVISEKKLLHTELVTKISQELNDEEYENYRNKLSHREDDAVFSKKVAYDLFVLFIQILKNYEDNGELTVITATNVSEKEDK